MITAFLSGILLALAFPSPWHKDWVPHAGLVSALGMAFLLVGNGPDFGKAFRRGYAAGLIWFSILLYWVAGIHEAGPSVAIPGFLFLVFYAALYPALILGLLAWAFRGRPRDALLAAPFLWAAGEWLRTGAFSGFPWGVLAQSLAGDRAWLPPAAFAGPYGPGFLVVLSGSLAAWSFIRGPRPSSLGLILTGSAAALLLTGGLLNAPSPGGKSEPRKTLALLQGAVGQDVKWSEESKRNNFLIYGSLQAFALKQRPRPEAVVWPEAASTVSFELEPVFAQRLRTQIVDRGRVPTIVGAPSCVDVERGIFTNAAQLWLPLKGKVAQYDKAHLVPLGEYVPLGFLFPWIERVARGSGAGDFAAGKGPVLFEAGELRMAPCICYEIIFPDLVRRGVKQGANVIVNLTNDDWYGDTSMPAQHLAFAVLRSVENGVPVARAANTGISALIDPVKGVEARTQLGERTALLGTIVPRAGRTFYTLHGDLFAVFCAIISVLWLMVARRRSRAGSVAS